MKIRKLLIAPLACVAALCAAGCEIPLLIGGMAQNFEREKKIEVPAEYDGLENRTVAILVQSDMGTLYEHPMVPANIAFNVASRVQSNVPGVRVRDPRLVTQWQYQTPGWTTMPLGDIAVELDVERVVMIDLYEFRLNPPGNRWVWDGVCAATVGIVEREAIDPDQFVVTYNVVSRFPGIDGLGRDSANEGQIQTGLLVKFVERTSWLFYTHIEDKYPE